MSNSDAPLFRRLNDANGRYSRNQRLLAKYVLANYQTVAFSTITELAKLSGVSEATIVRFTKALDFSGYPAFQKEVRRLVRADLKGTERFKLAHGEHAETPLSAIIDKELENISSLRESYEARAFNRALRVLRGASEVVVVGTRSTASLAHHCWFGLNKLAIRATRVVVITTETYDDLNAREKGTCVLVIGFPRYLSEQVDLLQFARRRRFATVTITDSAFSPLQGDVSLYAPAESTSFVAFHCAPLILVNALLHELSIADKGRTLAALNRFEAMAESRAYFHKG